MYLDVVKTENVDIVKKLADHQVVIWLCLGRFGRGISGNVAAAFFPPVPKRHSEAPDTNKYLNTSCHRLIRNQNSCLF